MKRVDSVVLQIPPEVPNGASITPKSRHNFEVLCTMRWKNTLRVYFLIPVEGVQSDPLGIYCSECGQYNLHSECGTYQVLVPACVHCGLFSGFHS